MSRAVRARTWTPLGHGVVGGKTGHEQAHAELGAEVAEDPLSVAYQLGIRPLGPILLLLHELGDSRELLVSHRHCRSRSQPSEEVGVPAFGGLEELGHGGVGRRV
ncbi:MAG TPA: hypothetical protein VIC86_07720, partial [Acidimicrobiales bacterium]